MLEVTVLASGSAGNSTLVRCGDTTVLIDAGISSRQLTARLSQCGVNIDALSGILITHEHSDHTAALRVLCSRHDVPIYCNKLTAEALAYDALPGHRNWRYFQPGGTFSLGNLTIDAFSVPHDAADPVGFRLASGSVSLGILTDLGYATHLILDRLRGVNLLLVESNHDEQLLQNDCRRPWSLKQRILSRHGHLSNVAAAAAVHELSRESTLSWVVLGHLSRDCNRPELALATVREALRAAERDEVDTYCAAQGTVSPTWKLA